jgi:hypothetical protein
MFTISDDSPVTQLFCHRCEVCDVLCYSSALRIRDFITYHDFYVSRIQQKGRGKSFVVLPIFVTTNFTKLKTILFLNSYRKKFEPIDKML